MRKIRGVDIIKIWTLSAIHGVFGMIFLSKGIFELFRINSTDISGLTMFAGFNLLIGTSIIILGILFAKNIFKPSKDSFFNPI